MISSPGLLRRRWYVGSASTSSSRPDNTGGDSDGDNNDDDESSSGGSISASGNSEGWIPPDRPLPGDKGMSHLYADNGRTENDEQQQQAGRDEDDEEAAIRLQLEEELRKLEAAGSRAGDRRERARQRPQQQQQQQQQQRPREEEDSAAAVETAETSTAAPPAATAATQEVEEVDWLRTRRAALGEQQRDGTTLDGKGTENDAEAALPSRGRPQSLYEGGASPPLRSVAQHRLHTLLSRVEIETCLRYFGGTDIVVAVDDADDRRMGGADGMVFATGPTHLQRRRMAEELVRHLRLRKLQECGVVGAQTGPEGSSASRDHEYRDQTWYVVDCGNYVVHVLESETRKHLQLERLWSGRDDLRSVNLLDDDAVDGYVLANPVPDGYEDAQAFSAASSGSYGFSGGGNSFDATIRQLQKSRIWDNADASSYNSPKRPKSSFRGKKKKKRQQSSRTSRRTA